MISSDIPETEVFYSTYGYVQVSRAEYDSPNTMVKFTKGNTFSGSLHVSTNHLTQFHLSIENPTIKSNNHPFKNLLRPAKEILASSGN